MILKPYHQLTDIYGDIINTEDIKYTDKRINFKSLREIIKEQTLLCSINNKKITIKIDNKNIKKNKKTIIVNQNTFNQIILDVFKDFIIKFCQNTRQKQSISVKTLNYKKVKLFFISFFLTIFLSLCFFPTRTLLLNIVLMYYSVCILIKFFFIIKGALFYNKKIKYKKESKTYQDLLSTDLPIYTILVPMYKENSKTIKQIIHSLETLNYPKHKLDIKLILEEDDKQSKKILKHLEQNNKIPNYIEQIWCPPFQPKTKPKACNIAALFAKGELVVIYDAEDKPEKNQLLDSILAFNQNKKASISQGILSFYNHNQNILTSCFNIEYLVHFTLLIQQLSKYGIIIPLGGTSNHIKYKFLEKNHFWDSYHVTEDLELSYISAKNNAKIINLESHTKEWCVVDIKSWFKQRIRWNKGYILTYLLILLNSNLTTTKINTNIFKKYIFYHIIVGYTSLSFLLIPILFISLNFGSSINLIKNLFYIANIIYYTSIILSYYFLCKKQYIKITTKTIISFFIYPFYFILHIIAVYLSLIDIIKRPFYWSKTKHNI